MKVILGLLLAVIALQCVVAAVPASFGTSLAVNATAVDYSFLPIAGPLSALDLIVSSSSATAASSVVINSFATLPIGNIPISVSGSAVINNGLPAGYAAASGPALSALGAGLFINMSADIDGRANAQLIVNPIVLSQLNTSFVANFRPLAFDASTQTYFELPANQYNISTSGGIQIFTTRSIVLIFTARTYTSIIVNITNGAVAYANLVANATTTFAFAEGTRTAFTLYNLTAAAGTFAVSAANNTANAAGNIIISSIYSLNHSAGANAQVSAQLQYSTSQSGLSLSADVVANAAWYLYTNNAWVKQSSSVSNGVVIYNTNHFSNWSVQSQNSSSTTTTTGGGSNTGSASQMSSVFSTLLKALF